MSDAEALMWQAERDPVLRSSFLSITLLDRPPDIEGFRDRMATAVAEIPRLHQRVVAPPGGIGPPEWADDPDFNLSYHVRHLALPAPGTDRQLLDMAALQYQDAFDPTRPLWAFTVVEGLEGGRAALLSKMHHTISDGVGALRLSLRFVDLERDPPESDGPRNRAAGQVPRDDTADRDRGPEDNQSAASATALPLIDALGEMASEILRVPLDLGRRAWDTAIESITHPRNWPRDATDALETARSALRQLLITEPAHSPLWSGKRSMARHFEVFSADLDAAKRAAHALGGTVNDVYVAGVAGGAGAYHRAKGAPVDELRASIPVNTRTDRSEGGNSFLPARVLVPAGIEDPVARFTAVHERLAGLKSERAIGITDALVGLVASLPPGVVQRVARSQVHTVDFAASNLRGAPFDLYIAGAHIVANYPIGPTGGTAFNTTLLSYRSSMDIGINIDTAAVDDPNLLCACIQAGIEEILAAGVDRRS
jgi:WS/DGAT/MGAT family acyltransferase